MGFKIQELAATKMKEMLEARKTPDAGLRIQVKGGGCSGLMYHMEWTELPDIKDKTFEEHGVKVFIDGKSYLYLMNSELSWVDDLMGSGFDIVNPAEAISCGCGKSFSV